MAFCHAKCLPPWPVTIVRKTMRSKINSSKNGFLLKLCLTHQIHFCTATIVAKMQCYVFCITFCWCKNEFLHLCFLLCFLFDFVKNSKHSIFASQSNRAKHACFVKQRLCFASFVKQFEHSPYYKIKKCMTSIFIKQNHN